MTWSGDAIWAIEEASAVGVNLDYEVPERGSNVWYDGWVIPKYARNPEGCQLFYQFMCRPEVALRNMDSLRICEFCCHSRNTGREAGYDFELLCRFKLFLRSGCRQHTD